MLVAPIADAGYSFVSKRVRGTEQNSWVGVDDAPPGISSRPCHKPFLFQTRAVLATFRSFLGFEYLPGSKIGQ